MGKYDIDLTKFSQKQWFWDIIIILGPKIAGSMFQCWLVYLKRGNPVFLEFAWVFCYFVSALTFFTKNFTTIENFYNLKYCLAMIFVILWSIRVGAYTLYYKVLQGYVDRKYEIISGKAENLAMFYLFVFLMAGIVAMISSCEFYFIFNSKDNSLSFLNILGGFIAIIGFIHSWEADRQLHNFRMNNKKKDELLKTGWWKKSRHPHIFFELATWIGFTLYGINDEPYTLLGLIGPALLYIILVWGVIPLSERYMKDTKADYKDYKAKTNKLWPY